MTFSYNIDFELASMGFVIIILAYNIIQYPKKTKQNSMFRWVSITMILTELLDIFSHTCCWFIRAVILFPKMGRHILIIQDLDYMSFPSPLLLLIFRENFIFSLTQTVNIFMVSFIMLYICSRKYSYCSPGLILFLIRLLWVSEKRFHRRHM